MPSGVYQHKKLSEITKIKMSETSKKVGKGKWMKGRINEKNPNWKGDFIEYPGIHDWLRKNFNKANYCENLNCLKISKNYNWCLIKGKKHERKRKNYWQLCISCHRKYDDTEERKIKISIANKGKSAWNKGLKYAQ